MNNAYILFGKSGSGKGTQADLLIKHLKGSGEKVLYLSTGEHMRKFSQSGSYIAGIVKNTLDQGGLLPEFIAANTWSQYLIENFRGNQDLVLDGLARRLGEAVALEEALKYIGIKNIYAIFINTSDTWSIERLLGRGRSDDNQADIAERLNWFADNTMQSIDYFKTSSGVRYIEINGEQTIENVFSDILQALQ